MVDALSSAARAGLAALLLALLAGCDGASADPGLSVWMRVAGAQFSPGAMPLALSGPAVASIDLSSNQIAAGEIDKPLKGALDPRATAAALGLAGDRGFWIVPAGVPEVQAPGFPTFDASLSFAPGLPEGRYGLVVRAVDADDGFGPPLISPLLARGRAAPAGALVVSLSWDTEADLDLHVVDPAGLEIWKRDLNSYQAPSPGQPVDPEAWKAGGILDLDSNAACVIDGRRQENVIWSEAAPKGHYLVRVDTASLCGEGFAAWKVAVIVAGSTIARAEGQSGPIDEEQPHDRGAGLLALEFDLP